MDIFFAKDSGQVDVANKFIRAERLASALILGVSDNPPYFVDLPIGDNVGAWNAYGTSSLELSRYWLNHFRAVDGDVRAALEAKGENSLSVSPYVTFEVTWEAGDYYLKYVDAAEELFKQLSPERVYLSRSNSFLDQLLRASALTAGAQALDFPRQE